MKKRAKPARLFDVALSDAVKDEPAFDSIMSALEADLRTLLARLRAGIASNAEQALAADLIEGKKKPKQPKGLPWYQRRELAPVHGVRHGQGLSIRAPTRAAADRH